MGLWPTKGDEERLLEAQSLPLSSRPERSAVEGPAVQRTLLGNVFRLNAAQWRVRSGGSVQRKGPR
jgi:hypothetical protein